MTFDELSHDELVKRCEGMWELNDKLWEVTKDLYENCVEGTADPEWWRDKLLDLGVLEEEESEDVGNLEPVKGHERYTNPKSVWVEAD